MHVPTSVIKKLNPASLWTTPCEINLSFLFDPLAPLAPYFNVYVKFMTIMIIHCRTNMKRHINIEIGGEGVKQKTEVNFAGCWCLLRYVVNTLMFSHALHLCFSCHAVCFDFWHPQDILETDAGLFPPTVCGILRFTCQHGQHPTNISYR